LLHERSGERSTPFDAVALEMGHDGCAMNAVGRVEIANCLAVLVVGDELRDVLATQAVLLLQ